MIGNTIAHLLSTLLVFIIQLLEESVNGIVGDFNHAFSLPLSV